MTPAEKAEIQRLFFALWPPSSVRTRLAQVVEDLAPKNSRLVAGENLHLTLVFLGNLDQAGRQCVEQAAGTVQGQPFTLHLSQVGHWPRPRVLWLGPGATPPQSERLVADLVAALQACNYRQETRPYRAHLTLARKVNRSVGVKTVAPISWLVDYFCLVESVTAQAGPIYRVLNTWPLESRRSAMVPGEGAGPTL